nr:MAG TPA: hypothetical protein [Caudoviricetes sp.]
MQLKQSRVPENMFAPCAGALSGQQRKFMLYAAIAM